MKHKVTELLIFVAILSIVLIGTFMYKKAADAAVADRKQQQTYEEDKKQVKKNIESSISEVKVNNEQSNENILNNKLENATCNVKGEEKIEVNVKHNNGKIPVLMYHSVDYEKGNELRIPKEKFREQMTYLKDNGYKTLTLDEFYDFLANDKFIPEKSIIITFDDGYSDNYTNAYPVLKELGMKAVVFVITDTVDKDSSYLSYAQIKEMQENGIDIESHTVNHDELKSMPYEAQLKTLKESKKFFEKVTGKEVKYLAYPFGKYNENTLKATKEAGYIMAFTTAGGWAGKEQGIFTLNRVYISAIPNMDNFKNRITNENYNKK